MDINDVQLVGGPCGQHGPYTFYKAFKYTKNGLKKIVTLSEFFFVKMWRDSDLLCIGELQLLWTDKNSEQTLASLRLYFLPENTPEGRMDQGEDEVLAISEKVVIRLEDLVTWITVKTEWNWGRLARCEEDLDGVPIEPSQLAEPRAPTGISFNPLENVIDFSDVEQEKEKFEDPPTTGTHVVILSFPKYCRYRAMMKRLEGVENLYLKHKIVNALGGFYVKYPNTRVLFCRDTFDYPELEGHELLCNHLAPKLKGRPRGKRKKRSISPESESNESESSVTSHFTRVSESSNDVCPASSSVVTRRSTRCHENNENKQFMKMLSSFMKAKRLPMGRVPSLGYKELNLHEFYTKVQKLGGYECVTTNRLWKSIFDDMTGHLNSTSAATIIRRHYERFLLAYERHEKGEEDKPLPISERRRLKSKRAQEDSGTTDSESGTDTSSTPRSVSSPPANNENKESSSLGKTSSLRSIRVKPERQKEKLNNDKATAENLRSTTEPNKEIEGAAAQVKIEPEDSTGETKIDKNDPAESSSVAVKVSLEETAEDIDIKEEERPKSEPDVVKASVPEGTKTEGSIPAEPTTNAVAPVAVTSIPEKTLSPIEGKENIPVITDATPKMPDDSETANKNEEENATIHNVKRIKLDILKEGGLEVTPVRSGSAATSVKEFRPSVIQPPLKPPSMAPPSLLTNVLPKRNPATSLPASINVTQIKKSSTAPVKQAAKPAPDSFQFLNGATPPKVVQSRSIYSYSEKTVYGNPKDVVPHAPKTPIPSGCDPVDLSLTSPQKPVIEIVTVPQSFPATAQTSSSSSLSYNRASVTKNLYKTTPPVLEGRKLGPNLEITLVNNPKQHVLPKQPSSVSHKVAKGEPGSRQSKYNHIPQMRKSGADVPSVPSPFGKSSVSVSAAKPDIRQAQPQTVAPPPFPPYVGARFAAPPDNANGLGPFLPLMDSLYYQAALQNVYSNLSNMPPVLPIPTPEQLKFYAELMAHGRLGMPFSQSADGHPSADRNKNP